MLVRSARGHGAAHRPVPDPGSEPGRARRALGPLPVGDVPGGRGGVEVDAAAVHLLPVRVLPGHGLPRVADGPVPRAGRVPRAARPTPLGGRGARGRGARAPPELLRRRFSPRGPAQAAPLSAPLPAQPGPARPTEPPPVDARYPRLSPGFSSVPLGGSASAAPA